MKKILSVLMAVVMLFTMFTIASTAATAPKITAVASRGTAKVGDTITVTVSTSKNSKLCVATLVLTYDAAYFEVTDKSASGAFELGDFGLKSGEVKFVGASDTKIADSATTLFTVSFKVRKTGGSIKFSAKEVYVTDGENDVDVTSQVSGRILTINCSHGNKLDTITKQPTCTTAGTKTSKCKDCGKDCGASSVPAKGHTPGGWVVKTPATCTAQGQSERKCTVCNAVVERRKDNRTEHKLGAWEVKTPATCTTEGISEKKCTVCNSVLERKKDAKKGHTAGAWEISVPAVDGKPGKKVQKCTVCNTVLKTEEYTINVKMGDINADGKVSAIDARMILQYAAENIAFTPEQVKRADMNGDGYITAFDARATLQAAAQED